MSLFIWLLSCNSATKPKQDLEKSNKESVTADKAPDNFKLGKWKIDSVAENGKIIDRLIGTDTIQIFNFSNDGFLHGIEVTQKVETSRPVGKWKIDADSIFILGSYNQVVMRYGYKMTDSTLFLYGNFEISREIRNKPTFYLSKYKDLSKKTNKALK